MNIQNLSIKNFRGFKSVEIDFDPKFNLIIGINGTGKTAILESLRIALGSLFLDMDKIEDKLYAPPINSTDILLDNLEKQYPVSVAAKGSVLNSNIEWSREVVKHGGNTRFANARSIKEKSFQIQTIIREGSSQEIIPLIAYYSTERFKREKVTKGIEASGSRLRGYFNSLDITTNLRFFLNLFRTEEFASLQSGDPSDMIETVRNAVNACIPDAERIYHHIKMDELVVQFKSGEILPFKLLSDGVRSMLAMVMEIAFRSYLLNPHLGKEASVRTNGTILIDELDLHLHPAWQLKVVSELAKAFPKLQFIATTHAPLVISSLKNGKLIALKDRKAYQYPTLYGHDANFILLEMNAEERLPVIKSQLENYIALIQDGKGKSKAALALRKQLEEELGKNDPELQKADILITLFE